MRAQTLSLLANLFLLSRHGRSCVVRQGAFRLHAACKQALASSRSQELLAWRSD
jgi:hypothetical protein